MSQITPISKYDHLQTGDILLFYTVYSLRSAFFRWGQSSKFNHIGIIIRDPMLKNQTKPCKGIYLAEITTEVKMTPLDTYLEREGEASKTYYRKLRCSNVLEKQKCQQSIKEIITKMMYCDYNYDITDYLKMWFINHIPPTPKPSNTLLSSSSSSSSSTSESQTTSQTRSQTTSTTSNPLHIQDYSKLKFFCSSFIALVCIQSGILHETFDWKYCSPKMFSEEEFPGHLMYKNKSVLWYDSEILLD